MGEHGAGRQGTVFECVVVVYRVVIKYCNTSA